jgi:hypothetical protein
MIEIRSPIYFINKLGSNMNFLGSPDILLDLKNYLEKDVDDFHSKFIQWFTDTSYNSIVVECTPFIKY